MCIIEAPVYVVIGTILRVKSNGKKIRELFDTKRAIGHCKTLKQAVGIFSLGLLDP